MKNLELKDVFSIEELQEREEFTAALAEDGGSCQGKCSGNDIEIDATKLEL